MDVPLTLTAILASNIQHHINNHIYNYFHHRFLIIFTAYFPEILIVTNLLSSSQNIPILLPLIQPLDILHVPIGCIYITLQSPRSSLLSDQITKPDIPWKIFFCLHQSKTIMDTIVLESFVLDNGAWKVLYWIALYLIVL